MLGSNTETATEALARQLKAEPATLIPELWSDDVIATYKDHISPTNVLKNTVKEPTMQPVIAIVGSRKNAEPFLRIVARWANKVDIILPFLRSISTYEQVQAHYIVGYVVVGGMPKEELALIEQEVQDQPGIGELVKKYDTPDEFRRAVYALRIIPSQAGVPIRTMARPTGVLNPTGA